MLRNYEPYFESKTTYHRSISGKVDCEKVGDSNLGRFFSATDIGTKDTNRKIRKIEFIYICGSKNGFSSSTVNTGEV